MAPKRAYGVDWEPYREEIISLYVKQNQTAEATVKYLEERHGLLVTLRQFKYQFDGHKKLSADDWKKAVLPAVMKRHLEGKKSEVYFRGEKLDPKRVRREEDRYRTALPEDPREIDTSEVIGSSIDDRIYVCTPPAIPSSPPLSNIRIEAPELSVAVRLPSYSVSTLPSPSLATDAFLRQDIQYIDEFDNSITDLDGSLDITRSRNCTITLPFPDIIRTDLLRDLPYFQLQSAVTTAVDYLSRHEITGFGTDMLPVLSKVIELPQSHSSDPMPIISKKLQVLIPSQCSPVGGSPTQIFLGNSQKPPIVQILELVAFMVSNSKMDSFRLRKFLIWVFDNHQEGLLVHFLRFNTFTTKTFVRKLVGDCAGPRETKFLKELLVIGIPLDHVAEELLRIRDTEFRSFVLSTLRPESISGKAGGRLLLRVVGADDVLNAKTLVNAGSDINYTDHILQITPLLCAVELGNLKMVKVLIEAGADPNFRSTDKKSPLGIAIQGLRAPLIRYLLEHGAIVNAQISSEIATNAERLTPEIRRMLERAGPLGEATVRDILSAASDSKFSPVSLSTHNVSKKTALLALRSALTRKMSGEVLCLLQHGPLRGCDKALEVVIDPGLQYLTKMEVKLFARLLIQEGAVPKVFELLREVLSNDDWDDGLANILIDAGFDLRLHGPRLVEHALASDCHDAAFFLIDRGTCINSYGDHFTPFQAVAWKGEPTLLKYLVCRGANVNQEPHPCQGFTPLQAASLGKSLEKVKFLLDLGAELNAPAAESGGATALEAAVRPDLVTAGDLLDEDELSEFKAYDIENGICVEWDEVGYGQNDAAVDIFRFLLKKGASVNRPGTPDGPLLHDIIERGLTGLLKEVLDAGAHPDQWWGTDCHSRRKRTPIQLAVERGSLESVKLLIAAGGSINAPAHRDYGKTALQAAAISENATMEMIRFLLSQGADVHAPPAETGGVTALQGAAIQGYLNIALIFISELGVDVNEPPALFEGRTAIEGAAEYGRLDMVQVLLNAGAVGDVLGDTGFKTAIGLARRYRHVDVAELLEAHSRCEHSGYLNTGL